jgi:hypothetical protein
MELRLLRWVKPGDVVNFDGATLTPEKKSFLLKTNLRTLQLPWTKGRIS